MKHRYVISRQRSCDGAIAAQCRLALLLFVSLAAAVVTHVVIDVIGDLLLAHDTYDDVAHASRQSGAIAIGLALLVTLSLAVRAALKEARGDEGALLILLRRALPRSPWRHWAAVTMLSLVIVAAMETSDAVAAGRPCDDVVALYGGSLLLAVSIAASVAALVTCCARLALRRLGKFHRIIIALAVAFIRIRLVRRSLCAFDWLAERSSTKRVGILRSGTGDRAPPGFPSLVFFIST